MDNTRRRLVAGILAAFASISLFWVVMETAFLGLPHPLTVSVTVTLIAATATWALVTTPKQTLGGPVCRECGSSVRGCIEMGFCTHCGSTRFLGVAAH